MRSILLAGLAALASGTLWAGSYTVGVEAIDYQPVYRGENGQYNGYARELLDAFASKYGHTLSYRPLPVARLFDEFLNADTLDFKFPDNAQWAPDLKKGKTLSYSQPAITITEGLMMPAATKGKPLAAVKSIGTMRGFTPWPYLDAINRKAIAVTESNTFDALIQLSLNQRVDGIYIATVVADYHLGELKKPGALVLDDALPLSRSGFSLSTRKHADVVRQFDEFLVKEKATVARIRAKYRIPD